MNINRISPFGLESVALALIFAPEPTTTFIGIVLLALARAQKASNVSDNVAPRYNYRFEDYYKYKVCLTRSSQLNYHVVPLREGQIPRHLPQPVRLYETKAWSSYRKKAYSYLIDKKPAQFSGLQRGLLGEVNRGLNRKHY